MIFSALFVLFMSNVRIVYSASNAVHAISTVHNYFIIVTYTLHLSAKKHIIMCFSDKDCYYLPPLSKLRFLFPNELSASNIVVLCSDQKFINVSHKNIDIKIEVAIFFINRIDIDQKLKKKNCDHTNHVN